MYPLFAVARGPKPRGQRRGHGGKTFRRYLRPIITFGHLILLTLRRLASRPALTFLSLLGIIFAVALLSSSAFFSQAVDRVILLQELEELSRVTRAHPLFYARLLLPLLAPPHYIAQCRKCWQRYCWYPLWGDWIACGSSRRHGAEQQHDDSAAGRRHALRQQQ